MSVTKTFARVEAAMAEMTTELPRYELDEFRGVFEHTGARDAMRYAMEKADSTSMPRRMRHWEELADVAEDYAIALGE